MLNSQLSGNLQRGCELKTLALTIVALLVLEGLALGQGAPSPVPNVPGDTVPAWVFYWVLGLASFFGGVLLLIIRILWSEARKKSALSEDERSKLNQLYSWHDKADDDQVPLWYTPRSWVDLTKNLREDYSVIKGMLTKVVDQCGTCNTDLREQLKERLTLHDQQQAKMLRVAMRVQQAVEALAGLAPPVIESDLDDGNEETG
jgi:hypothetical protein